jgi:hypothetical protein
MVTMSKPSLLPSFPGREAIGRLRRALALPLYALAQALDVASTALGRLAARLPGDRCGWIHEDCCVLAPPPK